MITPHGQVGTGGIADSAVTTPKIADSAVTTPKITNNVVTTPKLSETAAIKRMCSDHINMNAGEVVTLGKITTPIMITNIELFVGELGLTGALVLDVGWVDDLGGGATNALVAAFTPGAMAPAAIGSVILVSAVPIPVAAPVTPATAVMLTATVNTPDGAGERVQVGIEYYETE